MAKQATLSTDGDLQLGSEKVDATVSIYTVTTTTKAHKIFNNILCKLRKKFRFPASYRYKQSVPSRNNEGNHQHVNAICQFSN